MLVPVCNNCDLAFLLESLCILDLHGIVVKVRTLKINMTDFGS